MAFPGDSGGERLFMSLERVLGEVTGVLASVAVGVTHVSTRLTSCWCPKCVRSLFGNHARVELERHADLWTVFTRARQNSRGGGGGHERGLVQLPLADLLPPRLRAGRAG